MNNKMEFVNGSRRSSRKGLGLQTAKWLLGVPLLSSSLALAANINWTGTTDNTWSVGSNWDLGIPNVSDVALFTTSTNLTPTNSGTVSLVGINLSGATDAFSIVNNGNMSLTSAGISTNILNPLQQFTNNGSLAIQDGNIGAQLQITNNGTVNINANNADQVFFADMDGTGTLIKGGAYRLVLRGVVTQSNVTINDGALWVANGLADGEVTGNITNNSQLIFARPDSITYGGVISGSGSVQQRLGTVTLTGANTYTGLTDIVGGILQIGNGGSGARIASDIETNNSGGAVIFNHSDTLPYAGVITGYGGVTKQGSGTLIFSADQGYLGNTTINAGTLQLNNSTLISNTVNNGQLVFNNTDEKRYGGNISGTGELIKEGSGNLIYIGTLSSTGGITINQGSFQLGDGATGVGSIGSLDVTNNGTFIYDRQDNYNYLGVISGSGNLIKRGRGAILVFNNPQTYTGGTTVEEGILRYNLVAPQGNINVFKDATVQIVVPNSGELTYSRSISGEGSLIKNSYFGTLTLTGENTYTGGTQLQTQSGDFVIGDGATSGSIVSDITMQISTAVHFNRDDHVTYNNVIHALQPSGIVYQDGGNTGQGVLTFTKDQDYIGQTRIQAGTLELGNGGTGGMVKGAIVDNGTLIFNRSDDIVFDKDISGLGRLIKRGNNTLVLIGQVENSGLTTVDGGILQIGNGYGRGFIGSSIDNKGTVIFDRGDNFRYEGIISGPGSMIKRGVSFLEIVAPQEYTGGTRIEAGVLRIAAFGELKGDIVNNALLSVRNFITLRYDGQISGTGELTLDGGFVPFILTGENTYTGLTTNSFHSLQIGDPAVNNGTTGSLVSDIENQSELVFNRSNDYTYAGKISGIGSMIQRGAGQLTLLGDNTLIGRLTIENGAVQLGDGGIHGSYLGDIRNNAELIVNRSDDVVYEGTIDGLGRFTKRGAGTFTLLGLISNGRGVIIDEGTLKLGDGTNLGSLATTIENNGTLILDRNDNILHYYTVTGSGNVIKRGAGEWRFRNDTGYTGPTTVEQGMLRFDGTNFSSAIYLAKETELRLSSENFNTYAANISGEGALSVFDFGGKVTLTGDNTYTGGTFARGGQLQIGDGGTHGSITGDLLMNIITTVDRAGDWVYNGNIRSDFTWPTFNKRGSGALTLNGVNTYTGRTNVVEGSLLIGGSADNSDASISSRTTTVSAGATLGGYGIIRGNVANSGTVSPGASIGTLTIQGDYNHLPGSSLVIEVDSEGNSDLLNVGGYANINGGTLVIDSSRGFLPGHNYRILQAGLGLQGSGFANVDGLGKFDQDYLTGYVNFDTSSNELLLSTAFNGDAMNATGLNHNQQVMADYLLASGGDTASQALIGSATTAGDLKDDLSGISGAVYANQELQLAKTSRWFESQIADRMVFYPDCQRDCRQGSRKPEDCPREKTTWFTIYGSDATIEEGTISGLDTSMGGAAAGVEFPVKHGGKIGAAVSAIYFSGDATGNESATDDGGLYQFGLYTHFHHGNWDLGANLDVGGTNSLSTTRTVGDLSNSSNYAASVIAQQARVGYDLIGKHNVHIRPYVGILNQTVSRDSFTESGDGPSLSIDQDDYDSTQSVLGAAVEIPLGNLIFLGSLEWLHEFRDTNATLSGSLTKADNQTGSFDNIQGVSIGRDSTRVNAGFEFAKVGEVDFTALYEGEFASNYSENGAKLQISFDFS